MATTREQRLTCEALTENPAGASRNMITVPTDSGQEARRAVRFDSRRTLARRRIVRELDEFLGIFKYPDPAEIYAAAPSREAALDG
jgi:hypothetical protein